MSTRSTNRPRDAGVPGPLLRLASRTGRAIADLMDDYNEAAGKYEHLAHMPRDAAEMAALSEVLSLYEESDASNRP